MKSELVGMAGGSGESTEPTTDLCMRQLWPQIEALLAKGVTAAAMTEALAKLSIKTAHHKPNGVKAISNNNCVS